jgi:tetratricopeptide (TPR) repeat protein
LLESVERTRQAALADAQKAKGWQERERLRQAAEKVYAGSVSRIDELAASFAEIEGTAKSSQVFDEMTRILAEEGVDQARAYADTQRPGILEEVKARKAAASEKNRADLLPLLKSAQLLADRNQPAEAERHFAEIIDLEPDWPDARNAFAWFLIQRGEVIEPVEGNAKLREAVQICQGTLALNQRAKSPQEWARTQNNLGIAFQELGTRSVGKEGHKLLEDAITAFRSALEVRTKADLPQDWAMTQNNLGGALCDLGRRSGAEEGRRLLADAVAAFRSALEVYTKADLPQDWALTQNSLGVALRELGGQLEGEESLKTLRESVDLLREVVSYQPEDDASRHRLALALGTLASKLILDRQFAEAQTRCEDAQRLANAIEDGIQKTDRDNLIFIQLNLAHTLLFQGQYDEAFAIYRQNWEKPLNKKTFWPNHAGGFRRIRQSGPDPSRPVSDEAGTDLTSKSTNPR